MMKDPANILVFCIVVVFVSFVVYMAIQSRIQQRKSIEDKENRSGKK